MRRILTGAGALAIAVVLASSCDTTTRANDPKAALTPEAPAAAPAADEPAAGTDGTSGTSGTSGTAVGAPAYREVTIPAGTVLPVRLATAIASDTSRAEQRVDGRLARAVRIGGVEVLGTGASLRGMVTNAERSGRVKGRANVSFRFDRLSAHGTAYPISTRTVSRVAPGTKKKDAATIGIPAAGGAIIGGIVGGGDAAVKGGAIGGAAGTAAVLSTRGQEVRLAPGTVVSVRLARPLTVRVPVR